jgi:hypothetical protein
MSRADVAAEQAAEDEPAGCIVDQNLDDTTLHLAHHAWERAHLDHGHGACPVWHAPLRRLLECGAVITAEAAEQMADQHRRFDRADAATAHRKVRDLVEAHHRDTAQMRAQLAAVHRLLDHRRKTLRMDDLRAALEGELTWPAKST